jgi:hypothetical protein
MVFLNTLLFNWVRLDESVCGRFKSAVSCLAEPSKLAFDKPMCYWDDSSTLSSNCVPSLPSSDGDLVLTTVAISALLSIPVVFLLEVIVIRVLCRPVQSLKQVVPAFMLKEGLREAVGFSERSKRSVLCRKWKSSVGVSIGDDLINEISMDVRQLAFDIQQHRKKLKPKNLSIFDARWGLTGTNLTEFLLEIENYLNLRSGSMIEYGDVIVGKNRRISYCKSWLSSIFEDSLAPRFKHKGFREIWNDILEVRLKAEEEIERVDAALTDDLKGELMLELFISDLLRGILSEVKAKLFLPRLLARLSASLSRAYMSHRVPISRLLWSMGCLLLLFLNCFFLLYIFLFSLRQKAQGTRKIG